MRGMFPVAGVGLMDGALGEKANVRRAGRHLVSGVLLAWLLLCAGVLADEPCGQAGNLTYNCNFDNFVARGSGTSTPDGWLPWVTMGNPAFDADLHGSAPGAPAQRIWSDGGTWTAGLYQQVSVTAGKGYMARIQWSPCTYDGIERKIGIDPFGGIDPLSPHVIWGASSWVRESMPDLHVSAYAAGETLTIFVWTYQGTSHGQDQVFLDGVVMIEDGSMAPLPTKTSTAVPTPTRQPTRSSVEMQAQATDTRVPATPTPTQTATPTPAPTTTPLPTPTETATPTPSTTFTPAPPTATPPPTRTALPTVVPAVFAESDVWKGPATGSGLAMDGGVVQAHTILLYVAGAALVGGILAVGGLAWLWWRGRRSASGSKGQEGR